MRLALNMPLLDRSGQALNLTGIQQRARRMEEAGFDGIWLGDSFSPGMTRPDPLMWLLAAASATERIELGTCILIVPLRHPVELAQRLLTLHQLTGGRFTLGAGAGSTQSNYDAFGLDFDTRFSAMKRDLETISALCRGERVGEAFLNPWPSAVPGPRIVIGAWHSGIWLKRAIDSYDGWMCSAGRTNLRTMKEAIARYRDLGGRRAIVSSCMVDLTAPTEPLTDDDPFHLRCDPKEAANRLERLAELGFDDVLLVKQDHRRSRILHGAAESGRTLSIYESDYLDEEYDQIRGLLPRDESSPWPATH
jgi:alkanesulfonate monooxygenase SsuD/methylene tetrahydromethanopterin reductase-like flavin-dependent oxidoreductase (luciferase family)